MWDFPGFGLSKAHEAYTYSIQSQAEVMTSFIEKLHLTNIYPVVQEVGKGKLMAPSLAGSTRVQSHPDYVVKVLLHGLTAIYKAKPMQVA